MECPFYFLYPKIFVAKASFRLIRMMLTNKAKILPKIIQQSLFLPKFLFPN